MATKNKGTKLAEKASTPKMSQSSLRFPADLDTDGTGNVIRFNINMNSGSKYIGKGAYSVVKDKNGKPVTSNFRQPTKDHMTIDYMFSENYSRVSQYIDLYMPPTVSSTYGYNWGKEDLGMLGAAFQAGNALTQIDSWSKAADAWEVVKRTLAEQGVKVLTSTASALTPLKFDAARDLATSTLDNPYTEVLFNGVENRTFSFTFKLLPRTAQEQTIIKNICDAFKFHAAPEVKFEGQTNYLLFPSEFDIQFLHRGGPNPWLFGISTCALTNVGINHSPDGSFTSHKDGSPFATELTLQFTEMELLTKDSISSHGY